MPSLLILSLVVLPILLILAAIGFVIYAVIRYAPVISRIFEEKPMFLPLRVGAEPGGEEVRFDSTEGIRLAGTYYRTRADRRVGVLVFCHEFLSDRRSFRPYADGLRDRGFDVFTFDFRSHGESDPDPDYRPLQWVTDHEVADVRAALAYLRSRPDHDPAGSVLFGVSRGGSAALCASVDEPGVWGVITDGAFPTWGTMFAYIHRWAEIYVGTHLVFRLLPVWLFNPLVALIGRSARRGSERRHGCHYASVERAVARLAPRPWLLIHGQKDAYIGPEIARRLFDRAGTPKDLWIVPGAKHNRCLSVDPAAYQARLVDFLGRFGPIRQLPGLGPAPAFAVEAESASCAATVAG